MLLKRTAATTGVHVWGGGKRRPDAGNSVGEFSTESLDLMRFRGTDDLRQCSSSVGFYRLNFECVFMTCQFAAASAPDLLLTGDSVDL